MEFVLRCNNLKCRTQLHDRAVVTTCSHVFCDRCVDTTGLSRASSANRSCPACETPLQNPDDAVVADLSPSEDYKTSILSGLSPATIMECASRALQFHSYQTAQEIIYQEHLGKGLTDKYNALNQQMDQLIHDANSQMKVLHDKVQVLQADQVDLIAKNHELSTQLKEKAKAVAHHKKLYDTLKQQVMASQIAVAAGDEAESTLQNIKGHRHIDRISGARSGVDVHGHQREPVQRPLGVHSRAQDGSRSSISSGHQRAGLGIGMGPGPAYASHLQSRGFGVRNYPGQSASVGTPQQSRLPVLGSARHDLRYNTSNGPPYQASPMIQQRIVDDGGSIRRFGNSLLGVPKASRRNGGPLQR